MVGGGFGGFFFPFPIWILGGGWWFVHQCLHLMGFEN